MRVPTAITRKVAGASLKAQQNAPSLLFGAGVIGMIGSTVLACRATLKLDEVLSETQRDLGHAHDAFEVANKPNYTGTSYNEEDLQKDKYIIVVRGCLHVAKLYAPAIGVGALSIICLTRSKNILQGRNEALAAAYVAIDSSFKEYRGRVTEKYGKDVDEEMRYGVQGKTVMAVTDDGEKIKLKPVGNDAPTQYARFFDKLSTCWNNNAEYNLAFLRCQQNYANDMLRSKGHVFLNEVYDMLGMERSQAGAIVGWKIGKGDNYVDFGIFDGEMARHFVNGREGSILLDFNVDGVIWDLIEDPEDGKPWQS